MAGVPFRALGRIGRLPGVAYSERGAFMLMAASPASHPAPGRPGQVTTWALSGGELRALHRSVGGLVGARTTRGVVALRITGQVVLSPEITNEEVKLGSGGVMTLAGAATLSRSPLAVNVYLVRLRHPAGPAAMARLKREFPGVVLPAVPPPEVREVEGVNDLPLALAAGRWAWTLLAQGFAIEPVAVMSPGLLLAVPAVLLLANAVAAIPARTAARTRPAMVLRTE